MSIYQILKKNNFRNNYKIKYRWLKKGFQNPNLNILKKQNPIRSAGSLLVIFLLFVSWVLKITDVKNIFFKKTYFKKMVLYSFGAPKII